MSHRLTSLEEEKNLLWDKAVVLGIKLKSLYVLQLMNIDVLFCCYFSCFKLDCFSNFPHYLFRKTNDYVLVQSLESITYSK